ncbi:MAG: dipicolinate synthase subunit B [Clostridiales bacterium]|jgi:dipicolinate synthase subunit B|nr:dipicolinate synthase subunit B [Clostridiales bacterium]
MPRLSGLKIGLAVTGSFCTFGACLETARLLAAEGAELTAVLSDAAARTDTRFGQAEDFIRSLLEITGRAPITTITGAEPIGPAKMFDALVVSPCTGNTLAKIANAVTDTPVTMAVKAQLRNGGPVVIGVSSNDALGLNAKNLGILLAARDVYFVPFRQDDPEGKPRSLAAARRFTADAVAAAIRREQLQPIIAAE